MLFCCCVCFAAPGPVTVGARLRCPRPPRSSAPSWFPLQVEARPRPPRLPALLPPALRALARACPLLGVRPPPFGGGGPPPPPATPAGNAAPLAARRRRPAPPLAATRGLAAALRHRADRQTLPGPFTSSFLVYTLYFKSSTLTSNFKL